jgi:septum formation protein
LAKRLSREKAERALSILKAENDSDGAFILAADTVVAVGRRVLPKAAISDEAVDCLQLLSGRSHRVYTGICVITPGGKIRQKLVETRLRFKRLSRREIDRYVESGEWRGKAGGYAIQGLAGSWVVKLIGSYTNVVGLPLYEALGLLAGDGFNTEPRLLPAAS